jgi:WD40 repeat protein
MAPLTPCVIGRLTESSPVAIEYSPDGPKVAVGRQDGRTQIFAIESSEQLEPPLAANAPASTMSRSAPMGVCWQPQDSTARERCGDLTVTGDRVLDLSTLVGGQRSRVRRHLRRRGPPNTERSFDFDHLIRNRPAFSPTGDRLVTTGLDRATVSWIRINGGRRPAESLDGS